MHRGHRDKVTPEPGPAIGTSSRQHEGVPGKRTDGGGPQILKTKDVYPMAVEAYQAPFKTQVAGLLGRARARAEQAFKERESM